MLVIESMDVAIRPAFLVALVIASIGAVLDWYALELYCAKKRQKDLLHWLDSRWHLWLMGMFNVTALRLLLLAAAICAPVIVVRLLVGLIGSAFGGLDELRGIPGRDYLPTEMIYIAVAGAVAVHFALGRKGFALPISDKLSISVDKGFALALHIDSDKPSIADEADKIIAAIKRLRANGHHHRIVIRSWLCVSRPMKDNPHVLSVRRTFRQLSDITLLLDRMCCGFGRVLSRGEPRTCLCGRAGQLIKWVIRAMLTGFYGVLMIPVIWCGIRLLPPLAMMRTSQRLMLNISEQLGETVAPIKLAPVSVIQFMSMSWKLPHIHDKFSGVDGGFSVGRGRCKCCGQAR